MMPDPTSSDPPASGRRHATVVALAGATGAAIAAAAAWAAGSRLPALDAGGGDGSPAWRWVSPEAAFAHGARLVALLVASHLAAAQFLVGMSALVGSVRAQRWFDRLSLGLVGRICAATTTGMSTLTALSTPALAGSGAVDDPAPLLRLLEAPTPPAGEQPFMRLLPTEGQHPTGMPSPIDATAHASTGPDPAPGGSTSSTQTPTTWTVRPGESFWSIAEEHLATTEVPVVSTYWLRLIEANRHRLADPSDPDLLFSGQVLDLPPR